MKPNNHILSQQSIFGAMSSLAMKHKATNFTQGSPDFKTPSWLIDRLNHYCSSGFNKYELTSGSLKLRQAIITKVAQCYDVNIQSTSNVMITSGAIEAIFTIITT